MHFHPCGCATGIGSLPHIDPAIAVSLVKEYLPIIPHWPQLPRLSVKEHFCTQSLQVLNDLGLLRVENGTKAYFLDEEDGWPERLASFYELFIRVAEGDEEVLKKFSFPPDSAEGFYYIYGELKKKGTYKAKYLKGQVAGLLSVGFQITDQSGVPAYYDVQLRDVLLKQLSLQAAWQVKTLEKLGLPVIIFMDDPVIDSCGRYDRITVDKYEVKAELAEFASFVGGFGGLVGVHSCADIDWPILFDADLDIISFDAYQFATNFALYPEHIQKYLENDGVIAWGIVPTDGDALAKEDLETLKRRFNRLLKQLVEKGVNPRLLYENSMITPACGAGTLTEDQAKRIYQLTAELAKDWRNCLFV